MIVIGFLVACVSCCAWIVFVLALGVGLVFVEGKRDLAPERVGWFLLSCAMRVVFGFTALFVPFFVVLIFTTERETRPPPAVGLGIVAAAALLTSVAVNAAIWMRRGERALAVPQRPA